MRHPLLTLIALLALLAPAARAQSPQARQAILAAIVEFADAMEAADPAKLTETIWVYDGSIADTLGRDRFVKLVVAHKGLERVAAARFGAAGARFRCHFSHAFSPQSRSALQDAEIMIDLDSAGGARVHVAGETAPIRLRRGNSGGGRWQVVLEILDPDLVDDDRDNPGGPDTASRIRLERYEAQLAGVTDVAARIEKGQYASATAAEADLIGRYEKAQAEYIARRNAHAGPPRSGRNYRYYR